MRLERPGIVAASAGAVETLSPRLMVYPAQLRPPERTTDVDFWLDVFRKGAEHVVLPQTEKRYRAMFKRLYVYWISSMGQIAPSRGVALTDDQIRAALPISDRILFAFLASVAATNNAQSLGKLLTGFTFVHDHFKVAWPARSDPALARFMAGHRRVLPPNAPGFAQAMTRGHLRQIWDGIHADEQQAGCALPSLRLFGCLCTWAFYGLFRMGELLVGEKAAADDRRILRFRHVRDLYFAGRRNLVVRPPFTKNFAAGISTEVPLKAGAGDGLDPVFAWDFYRMHRADNFDYAFLDPVTQRLPTRSWFNALLKEFVPGLTGHSARAGGATDYAYRGFSFVFIQRLGRWNSDAFQIYIRNHPVILLAQLYYMEDMGTPVGPLGLTAGDLIVSM